jgi:putative N6-adenine-specific DNA methylase
LGFDARRFRALRDEAEAASRPSQAVIAGSDRDPRALELARKSAQAAGIAESVTLARAEIADASPPAPPPGVVVCNPPYGARLATPERVAALHKELGDALKKRFVGYRAHVLTGSLAEIGAIGLSPSRRIVLFNGPIECRLLRFELYSGTREKR